MVSALAYSDPCSIQVTRILKATLPAGTKMTADAKKTIQECTSEFISFITSEAADACATAKRKTMTGEDIMTALEVLGFDDYRTVLGIYLSKYRNVSLVYEIPTGTDTGLLRDFC